MANWKKEIVGVSVYYTDANGQESQLDVRI